MKVAIDADIPKKAVKALSVVYGSNELTFVWIPELVPPRTADALWADKFRQEGGRVTISADKNIAKHPHQILAFQQNKMISFFMKPPWSSQRMHFKAAHLIYWWPAIYRKIEESSLGDVWEVPMLFSNRDMKSLKIPHDVIMGVQKELGNRSGRRKGQQGLDE